MTKVAKGSIRIYEVACVAWFDLLGYGAMLEEVNFDPTASSAGKALRRLTDFHNLAAKFSGKSFRIQAINDGVIIFKDLSPRSNSVTFEFLDRLINFFCEFNTLEMALGYPGARMIISAGFRVRMPRQTVVDETTKLSNLFDRVRDGRISVEEAVNEAFHARPYFGYLPELQANFAFTKSYLVDSLGSRGGLVVRIVLSTCLFSVAMKLIGLNLMTTLIGAARA